MIETRLLSSAARNLIGFLPLILFLIGCVGAALFVADRYQDRQTAIDDELTRFDAVRSIAGFEPRLAQLSAVSSTGTSADSYLKASSSAAGSAELTALISNLAGQHGVQLLRTEQLQAKSETEIRQNVQFSGTTNAMYSFLAAVATSKPTLFVEKIVISNPSASAPDLTNELPMTLEMVVAAHPAMLTTK